MGERAFVFQGDMLLVPVFSQSGKAAQYSDCPSAGQSEWVDSLCFEGVPFEEVDIPSVNIFNIPSLQGDSFIKIVDVSSDFSSPYWQPVSIRQLISRIPKKDPEHIFRAFHIVQWRRESQFCGKCGAKNEDAENEFARICPECGRLEFPRIAPAIITLIHNRDKVLLAHNKRFTQGLYSLIAGFNEAGETLEKTVVREIREEVGLEVKDIRYIVSQPWPFPCSLMLGFTAQYAGGDIKPDGVEIEDARWFGREDVPDMPNRGSVARRLIDQWLSGSL